MRFAGKICRKTVDSGLIVVTQFKLISTDRKMLLKINKQLKLWTTSWSTSGFRMQQIREEK